MRSHNAIKNSAPSSNRALKYIQLARHFREEVRSGRLKPGDQLPSFAQMQAEHGIGQGTLERVYSVLENENLIIRQPKRGTFVAETRRQKALNVVGVGSGLSPRQHPYYSLLLQGIQEVAYREKIEVLLLHGDSSVAWEKMDGVILADQDSSRVPPTMPAISLLHPLDGVPCVLADEYNGSKDATEHLISLGHRKIAFLAISGAKSSRNFPRQRINGYQDALKAAGIKEEKHWIRALRDPWEPTKSFSDLGFEKMSRWLEEDWQKLGCTAIMAHNDDTAIGVLRALQRAGIKVPQEVSLMGFDGTEISEHIHPSLSTVVVPLREIGARGMELLLQQVDGITYAKEARSEETEVELMPTHLKVRDSTAKPFGS